MDVSMKQIINQKKKYIQNRISKVILRKDFKIPYKILII